MAADATSATVRSDGRTLSAHFVRNVFLYLICGSSSVSASSVAGRSPLSDDGEKRGRGQGQSVAVAVALPGSRCGVAGAKGGALGLEGVGRRADLLEAGICREEG